MIKAFGWYWIFYLSCDFLEVGKLADKVKKKIKSGKKNNEQKRQNYPSCKTLKSVY